jgi:hypothetical protein
MSAIKSRHLLQTMESVDTTNTLTQSWFRLTIILY